MMTTRVTSVSLTLLAWPSCDILVWTALEPYCNQTVVTCPIFHIGSGAESSTPLGSMSSISLHTPWTRLALQTENKRGPDLPCRRRTKNGDKCLICIADRTGLSSASHDDCIRSL